MGGQKDGTQPAAVTFMNFVTRIHRFVDIHQKGKETCACLQGIKSRKENKDVSRAMYRVLISP